MNPVRLLGSYLKKQKTKNFNCKLLTFALSSFCSRRYKLFGVQSRQRLGLISLVHEAVLNITKDLSSLKRKRLTFIQGICASAFFSAGH